MNYQKNGNSHFNSSMTCYVKIKLTQIINWYNFTNKYKFIGKIQKK